MAVIRVRMVRRVTTKSTPTTAHAWRVTSAIIAKLVCINKREAREVITCFGLNGPIAQYCDGTLIFR